MDDKVRVEDQPPDARPDLLTIVSELRQRHLFRIAAAYAVGAWLIIQIVATIGPAFELPPWVLRAVILAAIVGFLGTMGVLLFRPRREGRRGPVYLSRRTRLLAGGGVLLVALVAGALSINSLRADEEVTLAVLPFADLSPKRDKGFLAEGVAEEILSALGKNADLKVLGRTSSFALRDRAGDPAAIRSSLGVTHLLEGSVRSSGPDLRLSVRLIRTADGGQEWAEEYRGRGEDVFALQDNVATAVARRLSTAGRSKSTTVAAEITSADAYNLYLAARQIARTRTEPELQRAYALARQVVAAQPDYAPGHALLAELTWMLSDHSNSYGHIPVAKARPVAIAHAQKAIALAPKSADGYAALGLAMMGRGGDGPLERALKLDPSRSEIPLWLAIEFSFTERFVEGLKYLRRAVAIDPLWAPAVNRLSSELAIAGRQEEAAQVIRRFEEQIGNRAQAARFRATAAMFRADLSEIVRWGEQAIRLDPQIPYVRRYLMTAYHIMGLRDQAARLDPDTAQPIRYAYFSRGPDAAIALGEPLGAELWNRPDIGSYAFALGVKRDWARLAMLFDLAPVTADDICRHHGGTALPIALALRQLGREGPARELLDCLSGRVRRVEFDGPRQHYGADQAMMLSIAGKPGAAVAAINRMIDEGWWEPSFRLTDFPAFDPLKGRADFAAAQARLDALVARERRETLALR